MGNMNQSFQKAKTEIRPEKEYILDSYRWFTYSAVVTGLRLICIEDLTTGTVITTTVANPTQRTAAHKAWAGARQSRAAGMPWEILHEMGEKGVDPDQKLEEMFRGYGHASVGDMARLTVDLGKIPMHLCLALFHEGSLNSGQEKSTRYQAAFGKAILHPLRLYVPESLPKAELEDLEKEYQSFGIESLELFAKHRAALLSAFEQYYRADTTKPDQRSALTSRVLDCVRYFLLFGQWSGMSFETSARDWSRIIAELKASPLSYYQKVAAQIEKLLAPTTEEEEALDYKAEAPGLIRHTAPLLTTNRNLHALKQFLVERTDLLQSVPIDSGSPKRVDQHVSLIEPMYTEGDRLVASYSLLLWPGLEREQLLKWIHTQDNETKKAISTIIFSGHTNYCELPGFGRTTRMTLVMESFLGEVRDLNRHRAWGRFMPLPLVFGERLTKEVIEQIIARGFGLPLYLTDIQAFADYKMAFEQDLVAYYTKLQKYLEKVSITYHDTIDYAFVLNLLPLAHRVDLWMHGDPKQAAYFTAQRSRPGGHINYRSLAYDANQLLVKYDPYLSGMQLPRKPDPTSRAEFFDRS
jgi:thymidylate synthase ThyX